METSNGEEAGAPQITSSSLQRPSHRDMWAKPTLFTTGPKTTKIGASLKSFIQSTQKLEEKRHNFRPPALGGRSAGRSGGGLSTSNDAQSKSSKSPSAFNPRGRSRDTRPPRHTQSQPASAKVRARSVQNQQKKSANWMGAIGGQPAAGRKASNNTPQQLDKTQAADVSRALSDSSSYYKQKNLNQSRKLAEQYWKTSNQRKIARGERTPESRSSMHLPQPSDHPNADLLLSERNKELVESPETGHIHADKSAETMVSPEHPQPDETRGEDAGFGQSPVFFDPNVSGKMTAGHIIRMSNPDLSLNGKIVRISSISKRITTQSDDNQERTSRQNTHRSHQGGSLPRSGDPDSSRPTSCVDDSRLTAAGQIVRLNRGGNSLQPSRQPPHPQQARTTQFKSYSPSQRFFGGSAAGSPRRSGAFAFKAFHSDMGAHDYNNDQIVIGSTDLRRASPARSVGYSGRPPRSRRSEWFQLPEVPDRPIHYVNPLGIKRVWDLYKDEEKRGAFLDQILHQEEEIDMAYQSIQDDLLTDIRAIEFEEGDQPRGLRRIQMYSFQSFYVESSILIKKIRKASKILYQERLNQMMAELVDLQWRLQERLLMKRDALKEVTKLKFLAESSEKKPEFSFAAVGSISPDKAQTAIQVKELKYGILKDVCSRLRQKMTIYAFQLHIYERQEVVIVFEELWRRVYRVCVQMYYYRLLKLYVQRKKMRREVQQYALQIMARDRLSKVFTAWKQSKLVRLTYQQRVQNIFERMRHYRTAALLRGWRIVSQEGKLLAIDSRLAARYMNFKLCHKLFLKWRDQQALLKQAKKTAKKSIYSREAVEPSEEVGALQVQRSQQQEGFKLRLSKAYALLYDSKFGNLSNVRADTYRQVLRLRTMMLRADLPKGTAGAMAAYRGDLPLQMLGMKKREDMPVFKSFIRNNDPDAYAIEDQRQAMEVKHDIHSLLVETQNYYKRKKQQADQQEEQPSLAEVDESDLAADNEQPFNLEQKQLVHEQYRQFQLQQQYQQQEQHGHFEHMPDGQFQQVPPRLSHEVPDGQILHGHFEQVPQQHDLQEYPSMPAMPYAGDERSQAEQAYNSYPVAAPTAAPTGSLAITHNNALQGGGSLSRRGQSEDRQNKAPNQLFAMLEKKLQRLKQLNPKDSLAHASSIKGRIQEAESDVQRLKREKLQEVKELTLKLRDLRNEALDAGFQAPYSSALRIIGKEFETNPSTFRIDQGLQPMPDPSSQNYHPGHPAHWQEEPGWRGADAENIEYTETQTAISKREPFTRRSPTTHFDDPNTMVVDAEGMPDESYVQSSPGQAFVDENGYVVEGGGLPQFAGQNQEVDEAQQYEHQEPEFSGGPISHIDLPRQSENQTYQEGYNMILRQMDGQPAQSFPNGFPIIHDSADHETLTEQKKPMKELEEARQPIMVRHGPTLSIISKYSRFSRFSQQKHQDVDKLATQGYSMEDYIQFAIVQSSIQEEQPGQIVPSGHLLNSEATPHQKAQRLIFQRLHSAKTAVRFITAWRIRYYEQKLEQALDTIRACKLISKAFFWLKTHSSTIESRAQDFLRITELKRSYRLFLNWSKATEAIAVQDRKEISKFKKRVVYNSWVDYMNRHGDYLIMVLKAKKYHNQALTSKALLSLYTVTLVRNRAREFEKRAAFKKFFKHGWMPAYERAKALRGVAKIMRQKEIQWERTRFQREFNQMHAAFAYWQQSTVAYREVLRMNQAAMYHQHRQAQKVFCYFKKLTQISYALHALHHVQALRETKELGWTALVQYSRKIENMEHDWSFHRSAYIRHQILIRWREVALKNKLAKMFFQRKILTQWRVLTARTNFEVPRQFWVRYRQILVLKILKYNAYKNKKRASKPQKQGGQGRGESARGGHAICARKLQKKGFIALLENVYAQQSKRAKDRQSSYFYRSLLLGKSFQALKVGFLYAKKDRILSRVAEDFRWERIQAGKAFVVPHHSTYDPQLVRSVYTAWLQHTLDNFIKSKVLKRFQQYKNQKLLQKVFQAWRNHGYRQNIFDLHQGEPYPSNKRSIDSANLDLKGLSLEQSAQKSGATDSSLYMVTPDQTHYRQSAGGPSVGSVLPESVELQEVLKNPAYRLSQDPESVIDSYELTSEGKNQSSTISFVATDDKQQRRQQELDSTLGLIQKSQETVSKLKQSVAQSYMQSSANNDESPGQPYAAIQEKSRKILEELEGIFGKNRDPWQHHRTTHSAQQPNAHIEMIANRGLSKKGPVISPERTVMDDSSFLCEISESQNVKSIGGGQRHSNNLARYQNLVSKSPSSPRMLTGEFIDTTSEDIEQTPLSLQRRMQHVGAPTQEADLVHETMILQKPGRVLVERQEEVYQSKAETEYRALVAPLVKGEVSLGDNYDSVAFKNTYLRADDGLQSRQTEQEQVAIRQEYGQQWADLAHGNFSSLGSNRLEDLPVNQSQSSQITSAKATDIKNMDAYGRRSMEKQ